MFNSEDLYSTSGGVAVFNYWNPYVTKHDTSSFYNWEQDNLPLYDLEERTYYLWEKFGYPLSGVPGMAYVVSATVDINLTASANVFTSVSAAIEALPEIIRMPTLIEVAVSGALGELNLNNIKCEDDGILEIVNRSFASISDNKYSSYLSRIETDVREQSWIPSFMSGTLSGMLGTLSSTSALSVSSNTSSLMEWGGDTGDAMAVRNFIIAGRSSESKNYEIPAYQQVGVGGTSNKWLKDWATGQVYCNSLTYSTGTPTQSIIADNTISSLDLSTQGRGELLYPGSAINGQLARGIWTNNYLSKIKVENCDGPIYLRGFIVDGENSTTIGIGVYNCNDLTIENCGSMRSTEIGFDIKNSNIDLRRQAFAGRNYAVNSRGVDTTYGFKLTNSDVRFVTDSYVSGGAATFASHFHDYGLYLENSIIRGGDLCNSTSDHSNTFYTDLGYNKTGIYCSDSKYAMDGVTNVYGGYNNIEAKNSTIEVEQLRSSYCQNIGLLMYNSNFRYNKNLNGSAAGAATTAENATAPLYHNYPILFSYNGQNVVLEGGSTYTPTYSTGGSGIDMTTLYTQEVYFEHHGEVEGLDTIKPGVVVDNSVGEFTCGKFSCSGGAFLNPTTPRHLLATNNGTAIVRGLGGDSAIYTTRNGISYFNGPGATTSTAILADNESNIFLTGPVAVYDNGTAIAAINNSKIQVSPPLDQTHSYLDSWDGNMIHNYTLSGWAKGLYSAPNVLELHAQGNCLVADNKSSIVLNDLGDYTPFWDPDGVGTFTSSVDYTPYNWGYNSVASAGALQFYPNAATDATLMEYPIGNNNLTLASSFSGIDIFTGKEYTNEFEYDTSLSCYRILYQNEYNDAQTGSNFLQVAHGGMCVRATNDSSVKVKNVHFPMGHLPSDFSYYDLSGSPAGCGHLMIWNIADISQLEASYLTVSGQYPLHAGYTGPRSFYQLSGTEKAESSGVQYGVPSGTPDTGMLSVLDHYGSAVEVSAEYTYSLPDFEDATFGSPSCLSAVSAIGQALGVTPLSATRKFMKMIQQSRTGITADDTYGAADYQNRGPFRLYFSVLPAAKKLFYLSGGDTWGLPAGYPEHAYASDTRPYQHLSQGYLLSHNCSSHNDFSGNYPQVINDEAFNRSSPLGISASGYYYPEEMMPKERASVWLEKSAANTFSNAKHCNTDYSNRIKLVNIYDTKIHEWGDSFVGDVSGLGQGFRTSTVFNIKPRNV